MRPSLDGGRGRTLRPRAHLVVRRAEETTMSLRFYTWPKSSGTHIHWALEELDLPYELVLLDRQKGENRAPAYLAISPAGKVPAIVDGGQPYFASLAILLHLGATYGRDLALWPDP